jgi:hypothetical protein
MVQEAIAGAMIAYASLCQRGKVELAFAGPLARFAIGQVRAGRKVGSPSRIRDAMSEYAQRQKRFQVGRLDCYDEKENGWRQIVVEDKSATPAEVAAFRVDFASWLTRLPSLRRKIALALAGGETTGGAAKMFGVSPPRISQLRRWLQVNWESFQGEASKVNQSEIAVA